MAFTFLLHSIDEGKNGAGDLSSSFNKHEKREIPSLDHFSLSESMLSPKVKYVV